MDRARRASASSPNRSPTAAARRDLPDRAGAARGAAPSRAARSVAAPPEARPAAMDRATRGSPSVAREASVAVAPPVADAAPAYRPLLQVVCQRTLCATELIDVAQERRDPKRSVHLLYVRCGLRFWHSRGGDEQRLAARAAEHRGGGRLVERVLRDPDDDH